MNTLPQPMFDLLSEHLDPGEDFEIEQLSSQDLVFRDMLIIPDEQWDWTEAVRFEDSVNLRSIFESSIASGPRTQIFEKIDTTIPAYALLRSMDSFFWVEWK